MICESDAKIQPAGVPVQAQITPVPDRSRSKRPAVSGSSEVNHRLDQLQHHSQPTGAGLPATALDQSRQVDTNRGLLSR